MVKDQWVTTYLYLNRVFLGVNKPTDPITIDPSTSFQRHIHTYRVPISMAPWPQLLRCWWNSPVPLHRRFLLWQRGAFGPKGDFSECLFFGRISPEQLQSLTHTIFSGHDFLKGKKRLEKHRNESKVPILVRQLDCWSGKVDGNHYQ